MGNRNGMNLYEAIVIRN